ncbi:MAG TPA: amidohydrolase family protein, partial [Planctomycetota bacterium]|nr:amidohydrolase family protein [Planctomycetota bacterium]
MSSACRVARRRASAFRIAARRASIHVSRLRSACACLVVSLSLVSLGGVALADRLQTSPVPDLRDGTPTLWALTRARLVVRPGLVLENATIVIHEGKIAGAGTGIAVPAGARVLDLDGKTVYPGFIDAYGSVDVAAPAEGVAYWNPEIRPRADAGSAWGAIAGPHEALRSQGVVARLVAPRDGIVRGTSVIVSTGNGPAGLSLLRPAAALHIGLIPSIGGAPENYPRSPMGAAALLRQAFYDADWLDRAQGAHRADPRLPAPERNDDLEALVSWRGSDRIVVASVPNERWIFRADSIARELSLRLVIHGTGREYRRIDAIRALRRPIIVPLDFPRPPDVGTPESALDVSLEELLHWDFAPENPARLVAAGIPIAFTSEGLEDRRQFLARVRRAVRRGLDPNEALRALTTLPAELLGISSELGTVEPGKLASIIVTDGDIFDDDTKIVDVWVRGTRYELETPEWFDVTGTWTIDSKLGAPIESLTLDARGRGLRGELRLRTTAPAAATNGANESSEAKDANDANDANDGAASDNEGAEPSGEGGAEKANGGKEPAPPESIALARAAVRDGRLALVFPTERLGGTGFARLSAVISHGGDGALAATGRVIWPDGRVEPFAARRSGDVPQGASGEDAKDETEGDATKEGATESTEPPLPSDDTPPGDEEAIVDESAGENATRGARGGRRRDRRPADEPASFAVNYPLGAFGRTSPPRPERVLFQNATVWTCGPQGVIEDGDVLIENGWIIAIGKDLVVDATTRTVSLRGKH